MEWVSIPPGRFLMGGLEEDKFVTTLELPRHEVTIKYEFRITCHPVSNRHWLDVMKSLPPAAVRNHPDAPVVGMTWDEAADFCRLSGCSHRLPSEAEWEYICRAGGDSIFPNGSDITLAEANFLYDELGHKIGLGHIVPNGTFPANSFGVSDLIGNVCEWTADEWHPGFTGAPTDGSARTGSRKPTRRVIRGGAWDHLPRVLRSSWRDWAPASSRADNIGFRMVKEQQL